MDANITKGYDKAVTLLEDCATPFGFIAAKNKTSNGNYDRIWSRDSMICSLAALKTNNQKLIQTVKKSLISLAKYQHEQGEIPSNIDPNSGAVSFGGTAGRVDANLWFLIGFGQYVKKTKDIAFAKKYFAQFKKTIHLIRIHEFNHKGLIYVPLTGDWADEYIQEGYVLYDQLLYLQAFKEYNYLCNKLLYKPKHSVLEKIKKIKETILINYYPLKKNIKKSYNPHLFTKILERKTPYLKPYFNPSGYGNYFDLFANSLAILMNVISESKKKSIHTFVSDTFSKNIPAFYPVITKQNKSWELLQNNYGNIFRNKPYEYHNGGIWPMVLGFYACAKKEKGQKILTYMISLVQKNNWEFNEVFHGKTAKPNGTKYQAWSAAAVILSYYSCLKKKEVFL